MKKVFLLVTHVFFTICLMGQAPALINYQGVARNSVGNVLPDQNINLRLTIRDSIATGKVVYQESRNLKTNYFGMFTVAIGSSGASNVTGSLSTVKWNTGGHKFLQVEIDPRGGNSLVNMGTAQLLSVPYAIAAGSVPDSSITLSKIAPGVLSTVTGTAGGDLTGTFPNPIIGSNVIGSTKIIDGAVTTPKVADGAITLAKLAPGVIPTSLPINGTAGGDLEGTYPSPSVAANAITTPKVNDGAITTPKVADGAITLSKLAPGVIPTSLPINGTAGGDLEGLFPNPSVAANAITTPKVLDGAITTPKLNDGAITTPKVADGAITLSKLAPGVIPTSLPINGTAGGDLEGLFPNPSVAANAITTPKVADGAITLSKLAPGIIPTGLPPVGAAGGDLSGTYPNPAVAAGSITTGKLADGAVTNSKITDLSISTAKLEDGAITAEKLAPGLIVGGSTPSGSAGGDLSGNYPNPNIKSNSVTSSKIANGSVVTPKLADDAVTTNKIADGAVTAAKLAPGVIPTSLPINGTAGGDLEGTYPNPTVAANAITNAKIADGAITLSKLAPGVIPTSLPINGTAGGDLEGVYPNPSVAANAITAAKVADGAITTSKVADDAITTSKVTDGTITTPKVADGAITLSKLAPGVIPTSLPINGTAGGDLEGTYPNPSVAASAITASKVADGAITTNKIPDGAITLSKLAPGVIPTSLPINGTAGGDLEGTYPNPSVAANAITTSKVVDGAITTSKVSDGSITTSKVADDAITTSKVIDGTITTPKVADGAITLSKLAPGVIPTSLPMSGTAGGDLEGTYPNPSVVASAITTSKIADGAVTTSKIPDGAITLSKLEAGIIPAALPPSGAAAGDLGGNFPNPSVVKLQGTTLSNTVPTIGQVLKFDGTQWMPSMDLSGAFTLPYISAHNLPSTLLSITNNGAGAVMEGINGSTNANAYAIIGNISSTTPGLNSAGLRGINNGTATEGAGVWGSHVGGGKGVYGSASTGTGIYGKSTSGNGLYGNSVTGAGIFATSNDFNAAYFDISNPDNSVDALFVSHSGFGNGLTSTATYGNAVMGIANDATGAGLLGINNSMGEGVFGFTSSSFGSGVTGRNDGSYAGVKGINNANNGIAILAIANSNSSTNGTALMAELEGNNPGNTAVFRRNSVNVARIDHTGKGFFNGGTQVGGADIAEFFDVEGSRNQYEPGDVLVISEDSDRKVEKSATPYSTLVAGVYATKPGVLLTEKNAEQNELEGMVPMGVIGVIPTKVCLEGGNIKRGDLIVTSSIPGVAMKADPDKVRVGQVLGKALQDYNASGVGKINILVSVK